MNNTTKIVLAASCLIVAAALAYWGLHSSPLPGAGKPAIVYFPDGTTLNTTWKDVNLRVQNKKAFLDRGPSGGWMYIADNGQLGRVLNPGDPVPSGYDGKSKPPTPGD